MNQNYRHTMKTTKRVIFLFVSLFLLSSAVFAVQGPKTEFRKVKGFDGIKVSSGINLFLSMGDDEEVKIVADDSLMDKILTEVRGSTLHIYQKSSGWTGLFNWRRSQQIKVYVSAPNFKSIEASAGSDVKSMGTLRGDRLEVKSSSGSDVALDVVYKDVFLNSSSGSDIKMSGRAKTVKADASSGADIIARELEATVCHASASSGADIVVYASGEIYAKASSGADIRYYGNPEIKNIKKSSGGDVAGR